MTQTASHFLRTNEHDQRIHCIRNNGVLVAKATPKEILSVIPFAFLRHLEVKEIMEDKETVVVICY